MQNVQYNSWTNSSFESFLFNELVDPFTDLSFVLFLKQSLQRTCKSYFDGVLHPFWIRKVKHSCRDRRTTLQIFSFSVPHKVICFQNDMENKRFCSELFFFFIPCCCVSRFIKIRCPKPALKVHKHAITHMITLLHLCHHHSYKHSPPQMFFFLLVFLYQKPWFQSFKRLTFDICSLLQN